MKKLPLLILALSAFACVGKSKYNASQAELQACQQTAEQTKQELSQQLAAAQQQQNALFQEKVQLEGKTKEYEEMVGSLKTEIDAGNIKISELQDRLTVNLVDKVLFDSGSVKVKKGGQDALGKIAEVLKNYADKRILVEGHTDNVPVGGGLKNRFPTNWELSAARATTVARFLSESGVEPGRIAAVGFGEYRPVAANDSPEGKSQNRRIEISLLKPQFEKVPTGPEQKK